MRRLAIWAAIIVPIWIVMILCTHWEAPQRDGWGHFLWHERIGSGWDSIYEFAKGTYTHNNPRLGQLVTFLMFTPGPWHSIATPLLELGTFYLLVALVLGRWPRTTDDALLFLVTFALVAATAPQFGVMLFYRPYTGNYVFGLFVNLLFLIPYRFEKGRWPIMLVLGFASGLCNEHTGPAVLALAIAATYVSRHKRLWQLAGIVGMAAGGLALLMAPGQGIRYNGIGNESLADRLSERGVGGNVEVIASLFIYLAPALIAIAIGVITRIVTPSRLARTPSDDQRRAEFALVAGSLAIAATLLLSPKVGPRLYFASCAFACVAIASMVLRQAPIARWLVTAGAAGFTLFVCVKCVTAYRVVGATWAARVAAARHDQPPDLTPYDLKRSRWVLDDDMAQAEYRVLAAQALQSSILPNP